MNHFIRFNLSAGQRSLTSLLCMFVCAFSVSAQEYSMTVEAMPSTQEGLTAYRFYINMLDATDRMSAVYGNNEASLEVNTPAGVFNSTFNASWNASGINPAFVPVFPELVDDTYATIGLDGPAASSGLADAADPSVVEDNNQPITPFFLDVNATTLLSNTVTGSSWYILNTASNGLPDADLRVLIMQVTTAGNVSGQMNVQVFPLGDGGAAQLLSWTFDGAGQYGGSVDDVLGCTAEMACNFNPEATVDDGSCDFDCYGCMNANACNFNAEATLHDAEDCSFIFTHELSGDVDVVLEETVTYTYAFTAGSDYNWTVEGGVIVEGQGSHEVSVAWLLEEGVISVQEVNADGCEGEEVSLIVTGVASSISEAQGDFTAFPNPANDVVIVTTHGFEAHAFQVLDAAGRVVISERLVAGRNVVNVSHLANGTYRMVLDQAEGRSVKPLVIAH